MPCHIHFAVHRRSLILRFCISRDRLHHYGLRIRHFPVFDIADHGVLGLHLAPGIHLVENDHFSPGGHFTDDRAFNAAGNPQAGISCDSRFLALAPFRVQPEAVGSGKGLVREIAVFGHKIQCHVQDLTVLDTDLIVLCGLISGCILPRAASLLRVHACLGETIAELAVLFGIIETVVDQSPHSSHIEIEVFSYLPGVIIGELVLEDNGIIVFALDSVICIHIRFLRAV